MNKTIVESARLATGYTLEALIEDTILDGFIVKTMEKLAMQRANIINNWCIKNGLTREKTSKFKLTISESTEHGLKKFTLYPARGRNAKIPISSLTI